MPSRLRNLASREFQGHVKLSWFPVCSFECLHRDSIFTPLCCTLTPRTMRCRSDPSSFDDRVPTHGLSRRHP